MSANQLLSMDELQAIDANIYEGLWTIGWTRANYDGLTNGYFESEHYPPGSPEHDGYSAFVKAIRNRRAA